VSLTIRRYDQSLQRIWDDFVQRSKNGTFLFLRGYMEYHSDRFEDFSLLVLEDDKLVALFPANRSDDEVRSHQGLTYGGLVTDDRMTTPLMLDVFTALMSHLRSQRVRRLYYKTIPTIYCRLPAEEDRYALFLANAALYRRDVLSVVSRTSNAPIQSRRRRGAAKALREGVVVGKSEDWDGFWQLLTQTLQARFEVTPVHSPSEIKQLRGRFPENIGLYLAMLGSEILAGVVIYESTQVAHSQYIASSSKGRETGALDMLFMHLLEVTVAAKLFFDFGISNEEEGQVLNRGLIEQKEGFGARAVVHDFYRLDL
jgi:Acetyltransferase (GNAT) domain